MVSRILIDPSGLVLRSRKYLKNEPGVAMLFQEIDILDVCLSKLTQMASGGITLGGSVTNIFILA